jgi:hypothetical protein
MVRIQVEDGVQREWSGTEAHDRMLLRQRQWVHRQDAELVILNDADVYIIILRYDFHQLGGCICHDGQVYPCHLNTYRGKLSIFEVCCIVEPPVGYRCDRSTGECNHGVRGVVTAPVHAHLATVPLNEAPEPQDVTELLRLRLDGSVKQVIQFRVEFVQSLHQAVRCAVHNDELPHRMVVDRDGLI